MKKLLRYLLWAAAAVAAAVAAACTADPDTGLADSPRQDDDGKVTLRFNLMFPDTQSSSTRTMKGEMEGSDYANLDLYCVVFIDRGAPSANFLAQSEMATVIPYISDGSGDRMPETDAHGRYIIPFEVTLDSTTENAIIHFIAIDKSVPIKEVPMHKSNIPYGPENVVIPAMTTKNGHDAYWQRFRLGMPVSNSRKEEIEKIVSTLSPVPMIRNFAMISVETDGPYKNMLVDKDGKVLFELNGFCVVNVPDRGTIAPYSERRGFANFVYDVKDTQDDCDAKHKVYRQLSYDEVISGKIIDPETARPLKFAADTITKNYPYTGSRAQGNLLIQTAPPDEPADGGISPYGPEAKFIYERPFSQTRHTYIIVKGTYYGDMTAIGLGVPSYYKLDLGEMDTRGLFQFSHLLRNFHYTVKITNVEANGYDSPDAANKGQIYNNNLSAAIESQHLLSISDGHDMMYVNFTSKVLVNNKPVELWYRYFILGDNTLDNDDQIFPSSTEKDSNGNPYAVKLGNNGNEIPVTDTDKSGERIRAVVWNDPEIGAVNGDVVLSANRTGTIIDTIMQGSTMITRVWERITIVPQPPTPKLEEQTITLYRPHGLSRTVTLYLQNPWELKNVATYAGRHDDRSDRPGADVTPGIVSTEGGAELTIFFELPKYLPPAMFPLKFVIESNRQNIENDKNGTIVVQSAPSMFKDVTDYRIQYVKTVTWEEYDSDNEANYDSEGNYLGNIVRCRFLTITDLAAGDITQTETDVLIYNEYFKEATAHFQRK